MLKASAIRRWSWVHTWSSLVCTAFMLLLCVTGLPLIFHHEIDHLLGNAPELRQMPADTPRLDLGGLVQAAQKHRPGQAMQYFGWDADEPNGVVAIMAARADSHPNDSYTFMMDARDGHAVEMPSANGGFMMVMLRLHTDMFAGLPGKLLLAFMGLLFVAAIVSGVVLYAPFMSRLDFGTVRKDRSRLTRWLDLHNLIGVVTLTWALVVGITGVMNACVDLLIDAWRNDTLTAMIAPYKDVPPPTQIADPSRLVDIARAATPGMIPDFIAFPSTRFSSAHHYAVFMKGDKPLTAHLLTPVLIDAQTLQVTAVAERPWYMDMLWLSQPLHFGDYGGRPLQIIWAVLDVLTIIVLGSGIYLWVKRRKSKGQMAASRKRKKAAAAALSSTKAG